MDIQGCSFCLPIFIHSSYFHDGHTENTSNGTATFIKYRRRIYAVTCQHVLDSVKNKREKEKSNNYSLTLHLAHAVFDFSNIDENNNGERKDVFREIRCSYGDMKIDIVIAPLTDFHWKLIQQEKKRKAIDLDSWSEPDFDDFNEADAFGFPSEHKYSEGDHVASPCINIHAKLASKLSKESSQITLFDTMEEPNQFFFSGVSGGPIFLSNVEDTWPIGIIYEGQPGSSVDFEELKSTEEAFFTKENLLIKGIILNPDVFSDWLYRAEL